MAQISIKETLAKLLQWVRTPTVNRGLSQGDAFYISQRTDTGTKCGFGVGGGTSGVDHGIWSHTLSKWLIYGDSSTVYVNNIRMDKVSGTATKVGSTYTAGNVYYAYNSGCVTVRLSGMTFSTFSTSDYVAIATIPAGFRPYIAVYGTISHSATQNYGIFYVATDGKVYVNPALSAKSGVNGSVTYSAWQ